MRRFYRVWGLIAICLLSACETNYYLTDATAIPVDSTIINQYWENPLPKPHWLDDVPTQATRQGGYEQLLCVGINQVALAQPYQKDLDTLIRNHSTISINWQITKITTVSEILIGIGLANGASVGGTLSPCADVSHLPTGRHLAHISINLTHQLEYNHTWAFEKR